MLESSTSSIRYEPRPFSLLSPSAFFAHTHFSFPQVIPQLEENSDRKFIYVEMAFFKRWWDEQSESMRSRVQALVANGQLEFINGGSLLRGLCFLGRHWLTLHACAGQAGA